MDISKLVARTSVNSKNGSQDFELKFRRSKIGEEIKSHFEFSAVKFRQLGLDKDNGLIPMVHPEDSTVVILRVVPEKEAVWFKSIKGKEKSPKRRSTVLENDLMKAGILKEGMGNQKLKLEPVRDLISRIVPDYYLIIADGTAPEIVEEEEEEEFIDQD